MATRAEDLMLAGLLESRPEGGVLKLAGERAVILDTGALGLLRQELVATLGIEGARGVLTRFGFAHGWRTAETLEHAFPWADRDQWEEAGARLHELQGQVVVEVPDRPDLDGTKAVAHGVWHDSYEAEQQLLHGGLATEPSCWTLTGFASGYLSRCRGTEILFVEERCRAQGDAVCRVVGKRREDWGPEVATLAELYAKPCLETLLGKLGAALKETEATLRSRRRALAREGVSGRDRRSGLIAKSPAMRKALDLARRVAAVDSTALILGESGAGKERFARLIHDESPRAARPFVAVNCGAIPEELLESELFGHLAGSFTGATRDRPGLFLAAQGGTLFLDEIGELGKPMQVKLLRALQERKIRAIGETKERPIDVRVVAATNRDLAREVAEERFRQDLYYRLRVVQILVPPLRERREDLLELALDLLDAAGRRLGRKLQGFTPAAAAALSACRWPGNVRELENAIEYACVVADGSRIDAGDLPEEVRAKASPPPPPEAPPGREGRLEDLERDAILAALSSSDGHRERAAAKLGIGIATLYRKLNRYGIRDTGGRTAS